MNRSPKNQSYKIGSDDLLFNLVFFSTFEELNLPIHGPMEDAEVLKDSAASDGRRGSNLNVYEVNTWMWNFGRGKPRLGGLTVEETAMRKKTARQDQAKRSDETRRCKRADGA